MLVLISSSKTMHQPIHQFKMNNSLISTQPVLSSDSQILIDYLQGLSIQQIKKMMHISSSLANKTYLEIQNFNHLPKFRAIDFFDGDIYKGLKVHNWSVIDYNQAQKHLRILSGLYGLLRPLDLIKSYRLEMGYKIKFDSYSSLYDFWGTKIADHLPDLNPIINLLSIEYFQAIKPYVKQNKIISPKFLSQYPDQSYKFVAIHAKIGRGLLANWLIHYQTTDLTNFMVENYYYDQTLSTKYQQPTIVYKLK